MKNLKLFSKLQNGNTAFLILRPLDAGRITYFIMSSSVNYSIVTSGNCAGRLPSDDYVCFDVSLSSVLPLIDKNNELKLVYFDDVLRFEDLKGTYYIEPLCVEHQSDIALQIAAKFQSFSELLVAREEAAENKDTLENRLNAANADWKAAYEQYMSGWVNDSPFDDAEVSKERSAVIDKSFETRIAGLQAKYDECKKALDALPEVDMEPMRRLADAAARFNTVLSMCGTFAVVPLKTTYLFQRVECVTRAVQGKLLSQLIHDPNGCFYMYNDDIVFATSEGKGKERTTTAVFILPYLPNVTVSDTLISNGAVKEKYSFDLKSMMSILSAVLNKFTEMEFDMSNGALYLSNDSGEHFMHKFEIDDANTLELIKLKKGIPTGKVVMSTIPVPREVQQIIGMFAENFTVYVKSRKIIFQSGKLYAVFSREEARNVRGRA